MGATLYIREISGRLNFRQLQLQCMCQSRKYLLSGGGSGRYVLNLSFFGEVLEPVILSTAIAFFRGNQDWDETKKV